MESVQKVPESCTADTNSGKTERVKERTRRGEREADRDIASPQGDPRLSDPSSSQGAGGGARTRDRRSIPADIRADSLATVPPMPP
ncbi:hypothetical protein PoB_001345100 [Plakobranchus ocellatus]|uniref:Transformer n=1 Tax=Plakobranchus ocellatus TaxID=259542 RepID=A0AAV3YI66_9GAST|nr:hypothetical protein PoB_001345100 [Plakobranchus ocellatus]